MFWWEALVPGNTLTGTPRLVSQPGHCMFPHDQKLLRNHQRNMAKSQMSKPGLKISKIPDLLSFYVTCWRLRPHWSDSAPTCWDIETWPPGVLYTCGAPVCLRWVARWGLLELDMFDWTGFLGIWRPGQSLQPSVLVLNMFHFLYFLD